MISAELRERLLDCLNPDEFIERLAISTEMLIEAFQELLMEREEELEEEYLDDFDDEVDEN